MKKSDLKLIAFRLSCQSIFKRNFIQKIVETLKALRSDLSLKWEREQRRNHCIKYWIELLIIFMSFRSDSHLIFIRHSSLNWEFYSISIILRCVINNFFYFQLLFLFSLYPPKLTPPRFIIFRLLVFHFFYYYEKFTTKQDMSSTFSCSIKKNNNNENRKGNRCQ